MDSRPEPPAVPQTPPTVIELAAQLGFRADEIGQLQAMGFGDAQILYACERSTNFEDAMELLLSVEGEDVGDDGEEDAGDDGVAGEHGPLILSSTSGDEVVENNNAQVSSSSEQLHSQLAMNALQIGNNTQLSDNATEDLHAGGATTEDEFVQGRQRE
eukprot:g4185.t1